MTSTHQWRATLVTQSVPTTIPTSTVVIRQAGAQTADPNAPPIATIARGNRSLRRVPANDRSRLVGTIEMVMDAGVDEVWLADREWFAMRLEQGFNHFERLLARLANDYSASLVAWTPSLSPDQSEVYEVIEEGASSADLALDGPSE